MPSAALASRRQWGQAPHSGGRGDQNGPMTLARWCPRGEPWPALLAGPQEAADQGSLHASAPAGPRQGFSTVSQPRAERTMGAGLCLRPGGPRGPWGQVLRRRTQAFASRLADRRVPELCRPRHRQRLASPDPASRAAAPHQSSWEPHRPLARFWHNLKPIEVGQLLPRPRVVTGQPTHAWGKEASAC